MAGLFDMIGSPAERQETVLRKALEARRDAWTHTDGGRYIYKGAGDYMLRHGRFFSGAQLPPEYEHLKGGEGQCFENALRACKEASELRYFEGVYAVGARHYTPHAFCVTPDDRLVEVTFPTDPNVLATGREYHTKLPFLPLDRWGYWGVEFDPTFVEAYWTAHNEYGEGEGHVGIFDRPIHDAQDGENMGEWRDHWPIYTYPYDPRRTEP